MFHSHNASRSPVLRRIERADKAHIGEIVACAMARYQALYPEYDMIYMALPREDIPRRKAEVEKLRALLADDPLKRDF